MSIALPSQPSLCYFALSPAFHGRIVPIKVASFMPLAARADAISDQKKAYHVLGIDFSKNEPGPCRLPDQRIAHTSSAEKPDYD